MKISQIDTLKFELSAIITTVIVNDNSKLKSNNLTIIEKIQSKVIVIKYLRNGCLKPTLFIENKLSNL